MQNSNHDHLEVAISVEWSHDTDGFKFNYAVIKWDEAWVNQNNNSDSIVVEVKCGSEFSCDGMTRWKIRGGVSIELE